MYNNTLTIDKYHILKTQVTPIAKKGEGGMFKYFIMESYLETYPCFLCNLANALCFVLIIKFKQIQLSLPSNFNCLPCDKVLKYKIRDKLLNN